MEKESGAELTRLRFIAMTDAFSPLAPHLTIFPPVLKSEVNHVCLF
jgi:hypothetical protein